MSATISDHFNKASDMSGTYPTVATVSATRSAGATTLSCDDLGGWATDTPVHFSTFQVNTDGSIDTTTQTDWKGIVSGNSITDLVRLAGAADSGNASGDRVELNPTIGWLDDLVKGILVSHLQDGTLKDGIVSTAKLADDAVTSAKIADGAIDSYAQIADTTILARNLDFTTFNGHDAAQTISEHKNSVGSTWTNFGSSYTIPKSGLYFINLSFSGGSAGTTQFRTNARVVSGDTNLVTVDDWSTAAWSGNNFTEGFNSAVVWLNQGDIVKAQGRNNNWTGELTVTAKIQGIF